MRRTTLLGACTLLALGLPTTAHAYIDPGTGSLFLQVLGAFAVAALYPIQRLISRWRSPQQNGPHEVREEPGRHQG
jgi:hypothetical protein